MTIAANGLTATPLVNANGDPMWNGELQANATFTVVYSGSEFTLQSLPGPVDINNGTVNTLLMSRLMASSANVNGGISTVYGFAGNPNSHVSGVAATSTTPPDFCWDRTNGILYVCKTSGTTGWVVATGTPSSIIPISTTAITTAGPFSVAVPAGATVADVTMNGGGGGGGGATASNGGGSGGGGGAFIRVQIPVTTGNITGSVGAGGSFGTGAVDGGPGGDTTITYGLTWTAGGGLGGLTASGNAQNSVLGGAPSGSGTLLALHGQPSFGGVEGYSGSGTLFYGGSGGSSPMGGYGGAGGTGAANDGQVPGGGGGGAGSNSGAIVVGGAGATGQVIISFY
jgi:hypothetical protein